MNNDGNPMTPQQAITAIRERVFSAVHHHTYYSPIQKLDDLKALARHIDEQQAEIVRLRAALEEIAHPIMFMQNRLASDEKLDGNYAIYLSNDPEYLKRIACNALSESYAAGDGEEQK